MSNGAFKVFLQANSGFKMLASWMSVIIKLKNMSPGVSQFIKWTILFKFQETYFYPLLRRHVRLYKSKTYNKV